MKKVSIIIGLFVLHILRINCKLSFWVQVKLGVESDCLYCLTMLPS